MKGDGEMKKKSIFSLFGILMLIFSLSFTVVHAVPEPENQNSLAIHFYVQIQGVDTPLPGAEVGICRVADLKFDEHENAVYTLLPEFEALKKYDGTREVTFDGLSVSESIELAQKLAASIKRVHGLEPGFIGIGGGTVGAEFRREGIDAVVWSTLDDQAHQPNEYCVIDNLIKDAQTLIDIFST